MGVRLPVEMDPPRTGGSGLAGRGCATVEAEEDQLRGNINRGGGLNGGRRQTGTPRYRTTDSRGLRFTGFTGDGFLGLSGNLRAPWGTNGKETFKQNEGERTSVEQIYGQLHSALMAAVLTGR